MLTTKETIRALRGERTLILNHWLASASKRLWHLDQRLFARKGDAARFASETLAAFVAYYQQQDGTPAAVPPSRLPAVEADSAIPLSSVTPTVPPPAPVTNVFVPFAVFTPCTTLWAELPVSSTDLHILLELLAHELREGMRRRGADETTQHCLLGIFGMVMAGVASQRGMKAEKELSEYRDEALITQHLASRFLGNASHELRTPLTAVLGFAELLMEGTYGDLNQAQLTAVGHVENSAQNLLEIVNNLLDLLHIRAGKLTLQYHRLAIATLLNQLYEILMPLAKRKNVEFHVELPEELGTIEADENILRHIIYHLLSSSLRATPTKGIVRLRAERTEQMLHLITEDTALHLPPEAIANMIDPFPRIENSPARGYEGWEVGLPLVRRYIDLHGGTLHIESLPESGTVFRIALPVTRPAQSGREEESGAVVSV